MATYRLFVYGTLRSDQGNNALLLRNDAKLLGQCKVDNAIMIDMGAFPAVLPSNYKDWQVEGEVWEIDSTCLSACDRLEGVDHEFYQRQNIQTAFGKAYIYILHPTYFFHMMQQNRQLEMFIDGDWCSKPQTTMPMEEEDIYMYVDHAYLTQAGMLVPQSFIDKLKGRQVGTTDDTPSTKPPSAGPVTTPPVVPPNPLDNGGWFANAFKIEAAV